MIGPGIERRGVIAGGAAATAVGIPAQRAAAGQGRALDAIGLQLYTVRDPLQRDFEGTLKAVADIGYREVEFAGLFGHPPAEVRTVLDGLGLAAPSGHVEYRVVTGDWPKALEAAHTLGQAFIVCPWIDQSMRRRADDWRRIAETFNRAAETSWRSGLQFAYHNHDFEFARLDGELPYDILLAETDPGFVRMELDLYWITKGGGDPLAYFARWPGRFPLVHVKDMAKDGDMADVGKGTIDFPRIFARSEEAGIAHAFVEHDHPPSPLDSARASFDFLRQMRF